MRQRKYWMFQSHATNYKVCQQEISELTELAGGLIEFEKSYLTTHGEKQPVFNILSMINRFIAENIDTIESGFITGELIQREKEQSRASDIPFDGLAD